MSPRLLKPASLALVVFAGIATVVAAGGPRDTDPVHRPGPHDAITDVPGVTVGHYTHQAPNVWRGVTVIIPSEAGGLCAADPRGGNPVTIGDSTFGPLTVDTSCHAIVLTGGSFFGLATVTGVVDYLFERGRGVPTRAGPVPLVPTAVIFDLPVGDARVHPTAEWGRKAAEAAKAGPVEQGNVGAGTGGTMGKGPGGTRLKGGLGTASLELGDGVVVGAVVVLNALGDVVHPATGELYARGGGFDRVPARRAFPSPTETPSPIENTTLVAVATNARLSKAQLNKVAQLAHNGLARAIRPVHTMLDGDTVFVVSVGGDERVELKTSFPGQEVDLVGSAAADVVVRAVIKGAEAATSIPGWPSYSEWRDARSSPGGEASR
jgi:L-aminopeptidase/D-esterase-like protein